jgi:membrane fusion protein, multidrug efflux system
MLSYFPVRREDALTFPAARRDAVGAPDGGNVDILSKIIKSLVGILSPLARAAGVLGCVFVLSACSQSAEVAEDEEVQTVSVVELKPEPLPIIHELPGRVTPTRVAEVRARVVGIIMKRNFEQGSDVKANQVLYEMDPQQFQIEADAAEAALKRAEASFLYETQMYKRMEALAPTKAIAQAQLDMAVATMKQAEADVAARKADLARARLNLEWTKIRAPLSGRIGSAMVTEGALVGQDQIEFTHLATIQVINPIYVDFTQSVAELNALRRDFASGDLEKAKAVSVRLVLDSGEVYPREGRLLFSDSRVDPTTGQVTLRGEFANPDYILLPGMYVRVQITHGVDPDGLAVPTQAVRRNDAGASQLFVIRGDDRVVVAPVRVGRALGDRWQVLDGVKPGDRVIVEGFDKFVSGDVVKPMLWSPLNDGDDAQGAAGKEVAGQEPSSSRANLAVR